MTISATPVDQFLRLLQHLLILRDTRSAFRLPRPRRGGDPLGFRGQGALPGAFLLLLLLQALALLLQPRRVVALERIAPAALQLQHPAGDVVEEVAVMGHHHHGAGVIVQRMLQPGDAFGVQMVGRLVQQQQVGLFQQQLAQRHPPLLAARQHGHRRFRRRAAQRIQRDIDLAVEFPAVLRVDLLLQVALFDQQRVHLLVAHGFGELHGDLVEPVQRRLQVGKRLLDVLAHRLGRVERRFLRQIADGGAGRGPGLAAILGLDAGHDLHQRRFAGAVHAQHADFHAGQKGQGNALEDLPPAGEVLGQILHHIDVLITGHDPSLRCLGRVLTRIVDRWVAKSHEARAVVR